MAITSPGTPIRTGYASVSNPSTGSLGSGYTPLAGDVIVVWVRVGTAAPSWTVPSGWVNPLGGTTLVATTAHSMFVIYHIITATDQTNGTKTWTFTGLFGSSQTGATYSIALRGVDQTALVESFGSAFNSTAGTTHVLAADTPTRDNSMVLSCVVNDGTSTYTTAPTGWTFQIQSSGGQNGGALLSQNAATAASVVSGPTNITVSSSRYVSITLALANAANSTHFFAVLGMR